MSAISIRLDEPLLHEVDAFARAQHIPRTEYIRRAISAMNDSLRQEQRRRQLQTASQRVREANMKINREFSALDGDAIYDVNRLLKFAQASARQGKNG